ncbi:MAG: hypothetical protein VX519_03210 [Myxococcota bacterium]|nr:hypothetical protein [Myxococcota bacterium]
MANQDTREASLGQQDSGGAAIEGLGALLQDQVPPNNRWKGSEEVTDQKVASILLLLRLFYAFGYSIVAFSVYTLVDFYRHLGEGVGITTRFRVSMVAVVLLTFLLSHVALRSRGFLVSRIALSGLTMVFVCILMLAVVPTAWLPVGFALAFFVYMTLRSDNQKRIIVFGVVLAFSFGATLLHPIIDNRAISAFYGAATFGTGMAALFRQASTLKSGAFMFKRGSFQTWWDYEVASEKLSALDVLLESESRYAPSRVTRLWSRSAWTHACLVVENPSDAIKSLYGVRTREELVLEIEAARASSSPEDGQRVALLEKELQEELYVFEAVRPVVALTPLCTWMDSKEKNESYKIVVACRLKMPESRATVVLNMAALEGLMREVHGFPFTLDANRMIRGNYRVNKERYSGSIFCSELVAEAYCRVGLLPEYRLSGNYSPRDFSSGADTRFLLDARMKKEHRIRAAPLEESIG